MGEVHELELMPVNRIHVLLVLTPQRIQIDMAADCATKTKPFAILISI